MKREVVLLALIGIVGAVVGGLLQVTLAPSDRSTAGVVPAPQMTSPTSGSHAEGGAADAAETDIEDAAPVERAMDAPSGRPWAVAAAPTSTGPSSPPRPHRPAGKATEAVSPAEPGPRLLIPSVGVSAPLVATTWTGRELRVPRRPATVGLVDGTLRRSGATVVTGHVSVGRTPGALHPLHRLAPGAEIAVRGADGELRRWRATRLDQVPRARAPSDLRATDGPPRLVLVTCAGRVRTENGRRVFADLLIVTATPV